MSRNLRLALYVAIPVAVLLLPVAAWAVNAAASSGEVTRNVVAAGVDLGGLGRDDALAAIEAYEARLAAEPAVFSVAGSEFSLDARAAGFDIDAGAVVDRAMAARRDGGLLDDFRNWMASFGETIEIEVPVSVDEAALDEIFEGWEQRAIETPAYEGGIVVKAGRALPDYPRAGQAIDRAAALPVVTRVLAEPEVIAADLPLAVVSPQLTDADVDAAVEEANLLLSAPITFTSADPELEITFTQEDLAVALRSDVVVNSPARIELEFDRDIVNSILIPMRSQIEQPPVDARWDIDLETDTVTLVPSRPATLLDPDLVAEALYTAALSGNPVTEFPFAFGAPPEFTTEDAEAYGEIGLVSKFTTEHPAGQPRVTNIHLMADAVDGAIVWPGEEFSLNEHVGERTVEKGYVPAPMILRGELVDSVGGGVSQFATTFYNAVFYGCYEDVTHKPHSYYFSRYPEVNEATISWPTPDLVFRNDSEAPIIIRTQYTSRSITVKFFGNNGGKTCERRLGGRFAFSEPPVEYIENAEVPPGEEVVKQKGFGGWTNTVVRVMTMPDGSTIEQDWKWTYLPQPRIVEVHPCMVPESEEECPVAVPDVGGQTFEAAKAALEAAGFVVVQGETIVVDSETLNGIVVGQSPAPGEFLAPGSTVTLNLGVYTPPEDPPPDQ